MVSLGTSRPLSRLLNSSVASTDGRWDSSGWHEARELYHSIWPQESIGCPWAAPGMSHDETKDVIYTPESFSQGSSNQLDEPDLETVLESSQCHSRSATTVTDYDFESVRDWLSNI